MDKKELRKRYEELDGMGKALLLEKLTHIFYTPGRMSSLAILSIKVSSGSNSRKREVSAKIKKHCCWKNWLSVNLQTIMILKIISGQGN